MRQNSENRRKTADRRRAVTMVVFAALAILLVLLLFVKCVGGNADTKSEKPPETSQEPVPAEETIDISIAAVGDIIAHETQINSARQPDGTYDFSDSFQYVTALISSYDLALCNLETTFGGEPYTGYPMFSAPDSLAVAVKNAGFDVASTANNHMLDRGIDGIKRTVETASGAGLVVTGAVTDPSQKTWSVVDVKGIKIGIVSFTYETTGPDGNRSINGISLGPDTRALINSFSNYRIEEDLHALQTSITGAREDGADVIICIMHWGNEYERTANEFQKKEAQFVADAGADIIFASHPHVLQPDSVIDSGDRRVHVFWSMGNFISNQRTETLDTQNRYTEQGMIATARIKAHKTGDVLDSFEITTGYIPTWVDRWDKGGIHYAIVPLIDDYENNPALVESGHGARAKQAHDDIQELFGTQP